MATKGDAGAARAGNARGLGRAPGRGLGRGLSALMDEMGPAVAPAPVPQAGVTLVPVGLIDPNPRQPRRAFDEEALDELAESIRSHGVLQPILLRAGEGGRYEIVAGERRWRAAQRAGLHEIPAVVRAFSDVAMFEAALIENVQRQDLNPMEEAEGYQRLLREFGHSQATIAAAVGKSRSHVANLLRLAALPQEVQEMVRDGRLSLGHAKVLAGAPFPAAMAAEAVEHGWSVRQTEARVRAMIRVAEGDLAAFPKDMAAQFLPEAQGKDPDHVALEEALTEALGMPVTIAVKGSGGRLSIAYRTLDQLDFLIERLQG